MFGAKSAVIRTSAIWFDAKRSRYFSRQAVFVSVEPLHVAAHEVFSRTMNDACLAEVDSAIASHDLRWNKSQTFGAKTLRGPEKCVVPVSGHGAISRLELDFIAWTTVRNPQTANHVAAIAVTIAIAKTVVNVALGIEPPDAERPRHVKKNVTQKDTTAVVPPSNIAKMIAMGPGLFRLLAVVTTSAT
jgi:hypothetical protein